MIGAIIGALDLRQHLTAIDLLAFFESYGRQPAADLRAHQNLMGGRDVSLRFQHDRAGRPGGGWRRRRLAAGRLGRGGDGWKAVVLPRLPIMKPSEPTGTRGRKAAQGPGQPRGAGRGVSACGRQLQGTDSPPKLRGSNSLRWILGLATLGMDGCLRSTQRSTASKQKELPSPSIAKVRPAAASPLAT